VYLGMSECFCCQARKRTQRHLIAPAVILISIDRRLQSRNQGSRPLCTLRTPFRKSPKVERHGGRNSGGALAWARVMPGLSKIAQQFTAAGANILLPATTHEPESLHRSTRTG